MNVVAFDLMQAPRSDLYKNADATLLSGCSSVPLRRKLITLISGTRQEADGHHHRHALMRREARGANAKRRQPEVLYEFAGGLGPFSTDRTVALLIGNFSARMHNAIGKIELNQLGFVVAAICIPKKTPAHFLSTPRTGIRRMPGHKSCDIDMIIIARIL